MFLILQFSQKKFREKVLRWVTVHDQPFTAVEDDGFQDMIKFIRPGIQIPSADTLRRDLTNNFKSVRDNF